MTLFILIFFCPNQGFVSFALFLFSLIFSFPTYQFCFNKMIFAPVFSTNVRLDCILSCLKSYLLSQIIHLIYEQQKFTLLTFCCHFESVAGFAYSTFSDVRAFFRFEMYGFLKCAASVDLFGLQIRDKRQKMCLLNVWIAFNGLRITWD